MPAKLAYGLLIAVSLFAVALSCQLAISEGTGPAQEIKRRPPDVALIAYLSSSPEHPLATPASVPAGTAVQFRMAPARNDWRLQFFTGTWNCASSAYGAIGWTYTESDDPALGKVISLGRPDNVTMYIRGATPTEFSAACNNDVSVSDSELGTISPVLLVKYGTGGTPGAAPPGYGAAPDGIDSIDTLIYQTPGGDWVAQMLVSIGAAAVIMLILRSMIGLLAGIAAMPISAYGMAAIGYGTYWYVTVVVVLFILAAAAAAVLTRKN